MKKTIEITEKNINNFEGYLGNDTNLKVGDVVNVADVNCPCVRHIEGHKDTFSIYTGAILKRYSEYDKLSAYSFMYNRYAINDKFTK